MAVPPDAAPDPRASPGFEATPMQVPKDVTAKELSRALLSIVQYDQFDDWFPDPVYFLDELGRVEELAEKLRERIQSGWEWGPRLHALDVKTARDGGFRAVGLPLGERAVLQASIARIAPKLEGRALDRVFGLRYVASGRDVAKWSGDWFAKAPPPVPRRPDPEDCELDPDLRESPASARPACLFVDASDGMLECLETVVSDASDYPGEDLAIHFCDVRSFYASITPAKLFHALAARGPGADDNSSRELSQHLAFLRHALGALADGTSGLASLDDATGFLASAYLRPVDAALAGLGVLFARNRDEYFLISAEGSEASPTVLDEHLEKLGLERNPDKDRSFGLDDLDYEELDGGTRLWGTSGAVDSPLAISVCEVSTDLYAMRRFWHGNAQVVTQRWSAMLKTCLHDDPAPLAQLVQLMRLANRARADATFLQEGKGGAAYEHYRAALAADRDTPDRLSEAITARHAHRDWFAAGSFLTLASDLGAWTDPLGTAAAKLASDPNVPAPVAARAALALARAGSEREAIEVALTAVAGRDRDPHVDRLLCTALHWARVRHGAGRELPDDPGTAGLRTWLARSGGGRPR